MLCFKIPSDFPSSNNLFKVFYLGPMQNEKSLPHPHIQSSKVLEGDTNNFGFFALLHLIDMRMKREERAKQKEKDLVAKSNLSSG